MIGYRTSKKGKVVTYTVLSDSQGPFTDPIEMAVHDLQVSARRELKLAGIKVRLKRVFKTSTKMSRRR